jgi:hypothetical protein
MELKKSIQVAAFGGSLRHVEQWFLFRQNDDSICRYLKHQFGCAK